MAVALYEQLFAMKPSSPEPKVLRTTISTILGSRGFSGPFRQEEEGSTWNGYFCRQKEVQDLELGEHEGAGEGEVQDSPPSKTLFQQRR